MENYIFKTILYLYTYIFPLFLLYVVSRSPALTQHKIIRVGCIFFQNCQNMSVRKTPVVEKAIPVSYDLGNLAVADLNPLDLSGDLEKQLYDATRDSTQLLINQFLQLPIKRTVGSINSTGAQDNSMALFQLPEPLWRLPREKSVPKDKPKTRWELFAEKKGIKKRAKDGKLVFDDETKTWVPKWGYGGINKKMDNEGIVEYDDNGKRDKNNELIDPKKLSRQERKDLVRRSQHQQKKNAKAHGL